MAKAKPVVAPATKTNPFRFAKLLARDCRENGIRATARRCKLAHTSLVKMVANPGSIRADVMTRLAEKLGYSLAATKVGG